MKSFYTELILPAVSHLHKTDPMINTINFCRTVMTSEVISLLIRILSGYLIEINEEEAIKLRFISIVLGKNKLHNELNEHFPQKNNESNVNSYLMGAIYLVKNLAIKMLLVIMSSALL